VAPNWYATVTQRYATIAQCLTDIPLYFDLHVSAVCCTAKPVMQKTRPDPTSFAASAAGDFDKLNYCQPFKTFLLLGTPYNVVTGVELDIEE